MNQGYKGSSGSNPCEDKNNFWVIYTSTSSSLCIAPLNDIYSDECRFKVQAFDYTTGGSTQKFTYTVNGASSTTFFSEEALKTDTNYFSKKYNISRTGAASSYSITFTATGQDGSTKSTSFMLRDPQFTPSSTTVAAPGTIQLGSLPFSDPLTVYQISLDTSTTPSGFQLLTSPGNY